MSREKQIKLYSLALALTIAIASTIMLLGIQVGFNQKNTGAKITAPLIVLVLIGIMVLFKFTRKQSKTNFILKHTEGKATAPYFTIAFTYFDYMIYCGILSVLCGIISGILKGAHGKLKFDTINGWAYTMNRMAIVFAIYILSLVIFTIGCMIAYSQRGNTSEIKTE